MNNSDGKPPSTGTGASNATTSTASSFGEYDRETIERVHRENVRRSKEALAASKEASEAQSQAKLGPVFETQPTQKPRKVFDNEISDYQGFGGKKQMQKAQSRKRRQVRNQERSVWDNLAPKKYHGLLNLLYAIIFIFGLVIVSFVNGLL